MILFYQDAEQLDFLSIEKTFYIVASKDGKHFRREMAKIFHAKQLKIGASLRKNYISDIETK